MIADPDMPITCPKCGHTQMYKPEAKFIPYPNCPDVDRSNTEDAVNHPQHYGGKDNPYEVIKVIRAWELGFSLGNSVKYIARAGKKNPAKKLEDLKKAVFYLQEEISQMESK